MDAATEGASDTSAESGPSCVPHDVVGWTPPTPKRSVAHRGACSDEWTAQIVDDCFASTVTAASCNPWIGADADAAHKTCKDCVVTYETSPTYGAIIGFPNTGVAYANVAGCLEVLTNVTDCADKYQAAFECREEACAAPWCTVADPANHQAWLTCAQSADQGTCASYFEAYTSCRQELATGPGAACGSPAITDFVTSAKIVAKVFCGGG